MAILGVNAVATGTLQKCARLVARYLLRLLLLLLLLRLRSWWVDRVEFCFWIVLLVHTAALA